MKQELIEVLRHFSDVRVLLLGDFLLDQYVYGEISRVSREAPVLILSHQEDLFRPGGGANTVAGVESLGAAAIPVGFLGTDEWGRKLLSCWPGGLETAYVLREDSCRTTRKLRILAGSFHSFRQQVVRLDYDHTLQLSPDQEQRVASILRELVPQVNAVLLSDYSLGNVTQNLRRIALDLGRRHKIPVVVDSRFDPGGFSGATAVTPNITEIEQVLGRRIGSDRPRLEEIGRRLREAWGLEALLVTRGKLGMSLFEAGGIHHIPIFGSDEVVDVTGAGDTVIATFTTALAAGAGFLQAAQLANYAGGIVVTKKGTATVSAAELEAALDRS